MGSRMETLEAALAELRGEVCFSAIGSDGVDFSFILHLGEKTLRSLRLANPRLSFLQRTYEGTHTLLVEGSWRIDGPEGVLTSCLGEAKPRQDAIATLTDRRVTDTRLEAPGMDLRVSFEGGYRLHCFPTEMDEKLQRNNWVYAWPSGVATVRPRSALDVQLHQGQNGAHSSKEEEIVERWRRMKEAREEQED